MIESEVIQISEKCGFLASKAEALKLEASGREYYRIISSSGETKVLCYLDPAKGNHSKFLHVSNFFLNQEIRSPEILYFNNDLGVTIQEDLGDLSLIDLDMLSNQNDLLLRQSLEVLVKIQTANIPQIPKLEIHDLNSQMSKFSTIFLKDFLDMESHADLVNLQEEAIDELSEQPWMNCHFDFERRNLISNNNSIAVIDYQDLSFGPIGIDLAGLLIDHYIKYPSEIMSNSLNHYSQLMELELSSEDVFEWVRWGAIQRNMRILGTLSNLYLKNERSFRLKDLPMILDNLIGLLPEKYEFLKEYLVSDVKLELTKKLSQI